MRKHFFLIAALVVITLMAVAAGAKVLLPSADARGPGGPPGAAPKGAPAAGPGRGGGGRGGGVVVTPTAVGMRTFADRIEVLGVAKGRESVTLTSNNTEMVSAVRFRDGQQVSRGQVLVELKTTEEDAQLLQARSNMEQAKLEADRWSALAERGIAPKATAEQFVAAYRSAQANVAAVEARRGDRVIRAPFSGVIGLSDVAPGAMISPGTAIATLDDISVVRVDFDVPDRYLPVLRAGMQITARAESYPDQVFTGRIAQLDTRIDERTRSLKARAEFANPQRILKPGMLIRVGIEQGVRQALAAPESAVQFSARQPFVYMIGQRGEQTIAQQKPVEIGVIEKGFVEIKDGLAPGDRIIADGLHRVQPGQPISIGGAGRGGPPGAAAKAAGAPPAKGREGRGS